MKGAIMNKKYIAIFIILLILPLSYFTFRTEISVENIKSEYKPVNEIFVVKKDKQVILNGFKEAINNVEFNIDGLSFDSIHKKYGDKRYFYNFSSDKFYYLDEIKNKNEKEEKEDMTVNLSDFEIFNINGNLLYKLSEDKSKIIYINNENKLVSYNLNKNRYKIINYENKIDSYDEFYKNYNISIENGYISIYDKTENLSIFGADSGKLYGNKIECYDPMWLNDVNLLITHFDNKNNELKLGIYDVVHKKFKYFYSTENMIFETKYFNDNIINIFETKSDGILCLIRYNIEKKEFLKIDLGKININKVEEISLLNNKLILVQKKEKECILNIVDLLNNNVKIYTNISRFLDSYVYFGDEFIIIKKDKNYLMISAENTRFLINTDDDIIKIIENELYVMLNFKNENEYYLMILKK